MQPGNKASHVAGIFRRVNRQANAVIFNVGADEVPYPATRRRWHSLYSWHWQHVDHINMLEILAGIMRLRQIARTPEGHRARF